MWSLGKVLYKMAPWILPFMGEDFWGLWQWILSRHCHVPYLISFECEKLLKKLMTLDPRDRGTLEELKRDPWLSMGQEQELTPYREPTL